MDSPLATFHGFARLPKELRLYIWRLASSEPRTIHIHLSPDNNMVITDYFIASNPVPAVLHTCSESRKEASLIYTKAFFHDNSPRYTWISFDRDMIEMEDCCLAKVKVEDRERIKRICLEVRDDEMFTYYHKAEMAQMFGLVEVVVVLTEYVGSWSLIPLLQLSFEEWFKSRDGWVPPKFKMLEKDTGIEIQHQGEYCVQGERNGP